jgi:hypothetical protein
MTNPTPATESSAPDKPKYATTEDLERELYRRAHVEPDADFQLFDRFTYDDKTIIVGQPNPVNRDFVVWQAFHDEDEVRVYEVPHKDAQPREGAGAIQLRPRRITYPKSGGRCGPVCERLTFDRMVSLVAEEISLIVNGVPTAEMERAAIIDYLGKQHPATSVPLLIQKLSEGLHRPDDDEDETGEQVTEAIANGISGT